MEIIEESANKPSPGLSIIVAFYNSQQNSTRLISSLTALDHSFVEVICVDDGSTDETPRVLSEFAAASLVPVEIITQENSGPGKARNTGLHHARGEYVWFVDCDDDILVEAIDHFDSMRSQGFDFIDYDLDIVGREVFNSMGLDAGTYETSRNLRSYLVGSYGAICTKVTRRELLTSNEILYPEFCFYEDLVLGFVLPFFVERFHKANLVGYRQYLDFESVTRQKLSLRYFDRLHTSEWGLAAGILLDNDRENRQALEDRFIDLFIVKTTNQIFRKYSPRTGILKSLRDGKFFETARKIIAHVASLWYARSWFLSARVHRYYREIANELGVQRDPLTRVTPAERRGPVPWRSIWITSYLLRSQRRYFANLRMSAWGLTAAGPGGLSYPMHAHRASR
jgi:glycosyltransferase involved in cell wall biosynthesis